MSSETDPDAACCAAGGSAEPAARAGRVSRLKRTIRQVNPAAKRTHASLKSGPIAMSYRSTRTTLAAAVCLSGEGLGLEIAWDADEFASVSWE